MLGPVFGVRSRSGPTVPSGCPDQLSEVNEKKRKEEEKKRGKLSALFIAVLSKKKKKKLLHLSPFPPSTSILLI
jgi:hypothetical protein